MGSTSLQRKGFCSNCSSFLKICILSRQGKNCSLANELNWLEVELAFGCKIVNLLETEEDLVGSVDPRPREVLGGGVALVAGGPIDLYLK